MRRWVFTGAAATVAAVAALVSLALPDRDGCGLRDIMNTEGGHIFGGYGSFPPDEGHPGDELRGLKLSVEVRYQTDLEVRVMMRNATDRPIEYGHGWADPNVLVVGSDSCKAIWASIWVAPRGVSYTTLEPHETTERVFRDDIVNFRPTGPSDSRSAVPSGEYVVYATHGFVIHDEADTSVGTVMYISEGHKIRVR